MAKQKNLAAILSIIAGVIVVAVPQVLGWVVGLYLIIVGLLDLLGK